MADATLLLSWNAWAYVILAFLCFVLVIQVVTFSAIDDVVKDLKDDGLLNDSTHKDEDPHDPHDNPHVERY
jgi:hypothetical protein